MRLPAASTRDPLDVDALLPLTGNTELNYRTKPLTDAEERQQTYKLLLSGALIIAPVGLVVSWFWPYKWLVLPVLITGAILFLGRAFFQYTRERRQPWVELGAAALIALSALFGWLFYSLPTHQVGYLLVFPVTIVWAFGFAVVVANQVAFWMANHPKVHWEVSRQWESFVPRLKSWTVPSDCPEIRSVQVAPVLLLVSFGVGWLVVLRLERSIAWEFAALLGMVGFGLAAILFAAAWNWTGVGSRFSLRLMLRVTWKALTVWSNYNRHETKAAGVFLFPAPSLRSVAVRDTLMSATLVVLGAGLITCYPSIMPAENPAAPEKGPFILPREEEFLKSLTPDVAEQHRKELTLQRTPPPPGPRTWANSLGQICLRLSVGAVILTIGPPTLLVLITWIVAGPLLTRYYLALEGLNGYAQSSDREWDVYVNRLVESGNSLEKEHYLLGMSLFGDYPVLLHQSILNQHYHMTGDTGAAKTSLGMAPLATQMICKGHCSVVIIDLKGDMSLFESMRREAQRTGMPFRFFASEPGKTSHVFNPFIQSHLGLLTPEQRTESLLQAMSLDYGVWPVAKVLQHGIDTAGLIVV